MDLSQLMKPEYKNMPSIKTDVLIRALIKMFGITIIRANHQTEQMHGGIIGNVILVTGIAETADGKKLPYKVVLKTQKKWERPGDPMSWRREYDLCVSDFKNVFSDAFRWAGCYHAEMNDGGNETQIWMEHIDGVSGKGLTVEMLECASTELGRFQGRLYSQPHLLRNVSNLSKAEEVKDYYTAQRALTAEYRYIRSAGCKIPVHFRQMLIDADRETESIFANSKRMPVVLCHRDFWIANIIYSNRKIILIDWDSVGWGYMFEDVIQLLTDEVGIEYLEHYHRLVSAYLKGFSEYADISMIDNSYIWKMLVIKFGYYPVSKYLSAKSTAERNQQIAALQKVYNLKGVKFV